jgi:A/G-specific adenine glycosylase
MNAQFFKLRRDAAPLHCHTKQVEMKAIQSSTMRHIRSLLSTWYDTHRRKLPWRETRDPYNIWISEVMLQQTQVKTVIPYYRRFIERFPTLESLTASDQQEVLK